MSHKFMLHQRVQMVWNGFSYAHANFGEVFEIVRLTPEDRNGEASYRIRSRIGERAVRESEIAPAR